MNAQEREWAAEKKAEEEVYDEFDSYEGGG